MITASHNPAIYNGFKIKESFGGSARPSTTKVLEEMVAANRADNRAVVSQPLAEAIISGKVTLVNAREPYFRQLSRYVDLEAIRKAEIKAVVDPMYGAGTGFIPELLPGIAEIHTLDNPSFGGQHRNPSRNTCRNFRFW